MQSELGRDTMRHTPRGAVKVLTRGVLPGWRVANIGQRLLRRDSAKREMTKALVEDEAFTSAMQTYACHAGAIPGKLIGAAIRLSLVKKHRLC